MQVTPGYEYSALPTEDDENQSPKKKFSQENIFSKTITDTVNGITGNKINTSTNEVDAPLLEDSNDNIKTNEDGESYREKLYNLISKCGCINIFNPNYFFD